jgi:hypothetical protein
MKDIPTTDRVVGELHEKGRQQTTEVAFCNVFEIEIVKRNQDRLGLSDMLDVFDDRGT